MEFKFAQRMLSLKPSAIREILKFTSDPSVIPFAAGNPAPEAFPVQEIQAICEDILKNNPIGALQYSITEGYLPLRKNIKSKVLDRENIMSEQDEMIIVSGANQGIDLTCKVLCNEGDTVICENPSFIGSLNAFRSGSAHLVGVEMEQDGIIVEKLEQALKENPNTKYIYLIPNFQNPSGNTMSLEKRKAVYALAQKYDVLILEDNPYGELRFAGEHIPSIKSMDKDGRVVYCGSFSKIIAPGLRVGYLVGHKDFIQKIVVVKQVNDVHTNIFGQMICNNFLEQYDYQKHICNLREIYKNKADLMLGAIKANFNDRVTYTVPQGGLFLWCTLPDGVDMMKFCSEAVQKHKVAVVPGSAFMPQEDYPTQSFRMNYSTPTDEAIVRGVELLGAMTKKL